MRNDKMSQLMILTVWLVLMLFIFTGCGQNRKLAEENQSASVKISDLQKRLSQLESEKDQARKQLDKLQKELQELADREKLTLQKLNQYSVLTLPNTLVFSSGSAMLSGEGMTLIGKIADILKRYPDYEIRIEGHTDNKQIKPEFQHKFASNWELSSARATTVVRHLVTSYKMDPRKLGAVGYGEYRPIASNDKEEGRSKNRRVEFHIYPVMQSKAVG